MGKNSVYDIMLMLRNWTKKWLLMTLKQLQVADLILSSLQMEIFPLGSVSFSFAQFSCAFLWDLCWPYWTFAVILWFIGLFWPLLHRLRYIFCGPDSWAGWKFSLFHSTYQRACALSCGDWSTARFSADCDPSLVTILIFLFPIIMIWLFLRA